MEAMLRRKRTILLFILPALLLYLAVIIFPVFSSVYNSLFKWNIVDARRFVGLNNFIQLLTIDEIFQGALKNTFLFMFVSLLAHIPIPIALALALSGNIRGKRLFKTAYFLPNILSSVAVGLLWTFIYNPDFGIVNTILNAIGLDQISMLWLADEKTVLGSIFVVISWQFIGYHMILYLAAIQNIPSSMYESALLDGAGRMKVIRYITLPLIKPIIGIDAVLIATGSLRFFDLIFVMTNGGPNHASDVLASYMYLRAFRDMQYGYGSAISVVLLILCLVVTVILKRVFKSEQVEF